MVYVEGDINKMAGKRSQPLCPNKNNNLTATHGQKLSWESSGVKLTSWSNQEEDEKLIGHIEKVRDAFTCITQTHRLVQLGTKKDLLVSTFLHKTRKAIRPKQTLPLRTEEPLPPVRALAAFAAKDFCSLDLCWHYFSCVEAASGFCCCVSLEP